MTAAHTLRYYERAGLLEPVGRNGSGHRRYREADLERITFLARLRATGMRIQRRSYLEQNAGAVDVELTQGNLERIDAELPKPAGERYNEAGMAGVSL